MVFWNREDIKATLAEYYKEIREEISPVPEPESTTYTESTEGVPLSEIYKDYRGTILPVGYPVDKVTTQPLVSSHVSGLD